jgi:hypothetical protein
VRHKKARRKKEMKILLVSPTMFNKVAQLIKLAGEWEMKEPLEWKLLDRQNKMEEQIRELTRRYVGLEERLKERGII